MTGKLAGLVLLLLSLCVLGGCSEDNSKSYGKAEAVDKEQQDQVMREQSDG